MKPTSTLGAGCIVISEDKVLLVKPNYGKAKDHWILPGGFVENGELIEVAALRELKEETGQSGEIVSPFCVRYRCDPSDVYWVFLVRLLNVKSLVVQSNELIDVQYLPIEYAIKSDEVRPMTQYFVKCAIAKNPNFVAVPKEYLQNNIVNFFWRNC